MTKQLPKCIYPRDGEGAFHLALQREAMQWLHMHNEHRLANAGHLLKAALLLLLCSGCYVMMLFSHSAGLFFTAYLAFMLFAMVLNIVVNHDAAHNTVFRQPWLNRLVARIVTLPLGIEPNYWRLRHVNFHHRYPNVEHYDLDTEENGFFRQTPFQRRRAYMRYQHLYWPFIAAFSLPYIAWVFDWADHRGKTPLKVYAPLKGWQGNLLFVASKLGHFILVLALPIYAASLHDIAIAWVLFSYLLSQMIASLFVVYLLLGTHWAETKFYDVPRSGVMEQGWYKHNFATACDWLPKAHWLLFFTGGLNFHLTHHLFPGWHHRHYVVLADIIQKVAREHDMDYRCITYRELWASQRAFLKAMGRGNDSQKKP